MNVIKEYNTAKKKKGNVTFGAAHGGRWTFRCSDKESGPWEKIMKVPGGLEIAEKIAEVISKSWLRTAGKKKEAHERIDAVCRTAIDKLCKLRTLKDWTGETEWWSNAIGIGTKMIFVNQQKAPVVNTEGVSAQDLTESLNEPASETLHNAFAQYRGELVAA